MTPLRQRQDEFAALLDPKKNGMCTRTITRCIEIIKWVAQEEEDDEVAHSMEDDLREAVLEGMVRDGWSGGSCREMAAEVLKTRDLKFARWCA